MIEDKMKTSRPKFPEPVPVATQLAVLPFLAAVEGFLAPHSEGQRLRVTMHRVMAREKHRYIQQVSQYLGHGFDKTNQDAGRLFPEGTGLMGKAVKDQQVFRTRHYEAIETLHKDLEIDLKTTGSKKTVDESAVSFLAVPFVGSDEDTVLVLYVDTLTFNFFADNKRVQAVLDMCNGFCRAFDWVTEDEPLQNLRNFFTPEKEFKPGEATAFENLQEKFGVDVPKFKALKSFNFETVAA